MKVYECTIGNDVLTVWSLRALLHVAFLLQQIVQRLLIVVDDEVRGLDAFEDGVHRRLQVVEEERLAPRGEVLRQDLDDRGGREVRTVDMRTVDHYRRRDALGASAVLGHQIADVVHRREDQATVRRQHQVLDTMMSLSSKRKDENGCHNRYHVEFARKARRLELRAE